MSAKTTIIGRIFAITPVETFGERGFQKRSVIIDDRRTKDGVEYPCWFQVDFTGERMATLDNFLPEQLVQIECFLQGREYNGKYYHNIVGTSIQPFRSQQSSATAPTQSMTQTNAPAYTSQPQGVGAAQRPDMLADVARNMAQEADELPF